MAAYEALGKLGGSGTTITLGDFSKAPQLLFPASFGLGGGLSCRTVRPVRRAPARAETLSPAERAPSWLIPLRVAQLPENVPASRRHGTAQRQ